MSEKVDLNKKVDELEDAAKKYASKDTVISIGGYEFTPAKLMIAFTIVSSVLGGLYGTFEVYKDYQGMKKKIAEYVSPDLSELNKKMELTMQNSEKAVQYTQDIKNDLKQDVRRLEKVVEQVERDGKQLNREVDQDMRTIRKEIDSKIQKALDNPLAK
jgi:DNA anti-recombination protein RmuC